MPLCSRMLPYAHMSLVQSCHMDLYGWDLVCGCSLSRMNQLLAVQFATQPATLSFKDDSGVVFNLTFDPWVITSINDQKQAAVQLPIKSGSLSLGGSSSLDLSGVGISVQLDLAFVSNAASTSDLQFNLQMKAAEENDPTPGAVFVSNPDTTGVLKQRDSSGQAAQTLHDLLPLCLIQNKAKLAFVLNRLNLTPMQGWPAPQGTNFAFVTGSSADNSYLAVFSMLSAADTSQLKLQIDPAVFDGAGDVVIAFAPHVFLEHVIKPNLPASYPGTSDVNFVMSSDGQSIVNSGDINAAAYKYGLIWYYPVITSLTVSISSSQINTVANGNFAITGLTDASVSFNVSQAADCVYDANSHRLILTPSGTAQVSHDTSIPWWEYVAAVPVLPILGPLVGGIVIGIVDGVIAGVSAGVAGAGDSNMQSNSGQLALANWASSVIEWPGSNQWTVQSASLSGAFAMHCQLTPPSNASPQPPVEINRGNLTVYHNRCDIASWFGGGK